MGFYEEKGDVRYTMVLPRQYKDKIEKVAKTYRITQGEVIEVLLDQLDESALKAHFETKREDKVKARSKSPKRNIMASLKDMSSEQIAVLEAQIAAMKK